MRRQRRPAGNGSPDASDHPRCATSTRSTTETSGSARRPTTDRCRTPGTSARKEFERRHAKRERQIEETWGTGRLGRIAKFLSDDPQTTTASAKGAHGEVRVGKGVWISWPAKLADLVLRDGPLSVDDVERISRLLAHRLPAH